MNMNNIGTDTPDFFDSRPIYPPVKNICERRAARRRKCNLVNSQAAPIVIAICLWHTGINEENMDVYTAPLQSTAGHIGGCLGPTHIDRRKIVGNRQDAHSSPSTSRSVMASPH